LKFRPGEASVIPVSAGEEMRGLQTAAGEYQEDIYSMNGSDHLEEDAISSWTEEGQVTISLVFWVNATGTDRLAVWFIGRVKLPYGTFQFIKWEGQWRWNKKAWMNTTTVRFSRAMRT
jgi:hypothetical protein